MNCFWKFIVLSLNSYINENVSLNIFVMCPNCPTCVSSLTIKLYQNYMDVFPIISHRFSFFWPKTVFLHYHSHRDLQWHSGWLLNAGPVLGDLYKVLTKVGGDVLGQRSVTKGRTVGGHAGSVVEIQDLLPAKYKTSTNHTLHHHTINVLYMAVSDIEQMFCYTNWIHR